MKPFIEALVISAVAVFAPIKATVLTVGVLVISDLVFGMWAAKKRGEKLTSAGMRRTVSKGVIYQSAIILAFLVEKYLIDGAIPFSKIIAGMIGTVELKSLLESLEAINGTPIFTTLISKLGSKNDQPPGT